MAHDFRLLTTGAGNAAYNMGSDEAILEAVAAEDALPTLRLYAWKPAAVSIGYFQGLYEEVDTAACAARGVDVVRRITGGGAVFHQAEITYSIVIPDAHPLAQRSILASYERLCSGVMEGLSLLGIPSVFAPINDILTGGRKVSGNAQTRRRSCILQHGTVILDLDVELMFDLLKVPAEKAKGKLIQDVKARVTSVRSCLGRELAFPEAEDAFSRGFAKALDLVFAQKETALAGSEDQRARAIATEKFSDPAWTGKR